MIARGHRGVFVRPETVLRFYGGSETAVQVKGKSSSTPTSWPPVQGQRGRAGFLGRRKLYLYHVTFLNYWPVPSTLQRLWTAAWVRLDDFGRNLSDHDECSSSLSRGVRSLPRPPRTHRGRRRNASTKGVLRYDRLRSLKC